MSLLANEFDVRSVLHGQVGLTVSIKFCVIHEAMNGCKSKDSLKDCFENVNIMVSHHRKGLKFSKKKKGNLSKVLINNNSFYMYNL